MQDRNGEKRSGQDEARYVGSCWRQARAVARAVGANKPVRCRGVVPGMQRWRWHAGWRSPHRAAQDRQQGVSACGRLQDGAWTAQRPLRARRLVYLKLTSHIGRSGWANDLDLSTFHMVEQPE
ncbi:hypothetical protein CHU98_g9978 [Xylaria longipes]|nr:hypothetical protein CHU98_g9978 [Xylaria longipes]